MREQQTHCASGRVHCPPPKDYQGADGATWTWPREVADVEMKSNSYQDQTTQEPTKQKSDLKQFKAGAGPGDGGQTVILELGTKSSKPVWAT